MEENLFSKILTRVHADEITTSNFYKDEEFENFIEILNEDIGKFKNYTYDGRAQDLIFKGLKKFSPLATKYGQFLKYLEVEFDKLVVPCIILDDIKRKSSYISVDRLVKEVDVRNTDYHIKDIKGINIFKNSMPSVVSVKQENLKTYKVVQKGQFAFSGMQTGRDLCIRIALHKDDEPIIISPAYIVLEMCNDDMLAEFFMLWFSRNEIDRYGWFVSDGSIRANLDIDRFYEMQIPIPDIKIQQSIVDI